MSTDEPDKYLVITSSVLGLLLAISEWLGWSKCKANSITQLVSTHIVPAPPTPPEQRAPTPYCCEVHHRQHN